MTGRGRTTRVWRLFLLGVALLCAAPGSAFAADCTITLTTTAASPSWHVPANWDKGRVPEASDHVCLPDRDTTQIVAFSGTASVASLQVAETLRISGGRLDLTSGTDLSTISGTLELISGSLGGSGELRVSGRFVWSGGTHDGSGTTVIEAAGIAELVGGSVQMGGTRRLRNDGELRVGDFSFVFVVSGGAPVIENHGLLVKTAGASSFIDPALVNHGRIESRSGQLNLRGGSPAAEPSTGAFGPGSNGGLVDLEDRTFTLGTGATLAGARITGARVNVDGNAGASGAGVELIVGALGGSGELRVSGRFVWSGGTHDGSGTTVIEAAGIAELVGGSVQMGGTRRLRNDGELRVGDFSFVFVVSGGAPVIENHGLLVKTAGASSFIDPALVNHGRIESRSGQLNLRGGSPAAEPSTGAFGPGSNGGLVDLEDRTFTLGTGATLAGARITGARVNVDGNAGASGAGVELIVGALGGSGELRVSGRFVWSGGTHDGSGTTVIEAAGIAELVGGSVQMGGTRRLRNDGELRVGDFSFVFVVSGGAPVIENHGLLVKTAGASSFIDPALVNHGRIESRSGQLNLRGGSPAAEPSTGAFGPGSNGGLVDLEDRTFTLGTGATLAGARITGARVNVDGNAGASGAGVELIVGALGGSGELRVSGRFVWSGGTHDGSGTTVIEAAGIAELVGGSVQMGGTRRLRNDGELRVGDFSFVFVVSGGAPVIENHGLLVKTAGASSFIDPALVNHGRIESRSGQLNLRGGSPAAEPSTGAFGPGSNGGLVDLEDRTFTLVDGASLSDGARITGGLLNVGGRVLVTGGVFLSSSATGPGDLVVDGVLRWDLGVLSGDGLMHVRPGGRLESEGFRTLERPLRNDGEVRVTSSSLVLGRSAVVDNHGLLQLQGDGSVRGGSGGGAPIRNSGTLAKADTVGGSIDVPFENDGVVDVRAGSVRFLSRYTQTDDGTLRVEVRGAASGQGFGRVDTESRVLLGGVVRFETSGFTPAIGDRFTILTHRSASRRGAVRRIDTVGLPPQLAVTLEYTNDAIVAVIGPAPGIETDRIPAAAMAPVPASDAPLANRAPAARSERYVVAPGGVRVFGPARGLLANDAEADGEPLRLVLRDRPPRRLGVSIDAAEGSLRVRRPAAGTRVCLRYAVVDARGARSRDAAVRVIVPGHGTPRLRFDRCAGLR